MILQNVSLELMGPVYVAASPSDKSLSPLRYSDDSDGEDDQKDNTLSTSSVPLKIDNPVKATVEVSCTSFYNG